MIRRAMSSIRTLSALLIAALIVLALATYRDSDRNGFHFDDHPNIVQHASVQLEELSAAGLWRAAREAYLPSRPLPSVTFALDWWRSQGQAAAFQATNRILHLSVALAVGLLFYASLSKILPRRELAWLVPLAAAWWALHPIQVQGVTYIVQRMAILATLFSVLSVWCFIQARKSHSQRSVAWWLAAVLSLFAGVVSKENAYITPALWVLAEYGVIRHGMPVNRRHLRAIFLLAPAVILFIATLDLALGGPLAAFVGPGYLTRDFTLTERLLTQPRVLVFHIGQIVWPLPSRFSLEHDFGLSRGLFDPPGTMVALTLVLLWCGSGLWCLFRQETRVLGFLILWVPTTLLIESSVISLEIVFEHRMYLPTVGLAGVLALGVGRLAGKLERGRVFVPVVGLGVALVLAFYTHERISVWRTPVSLGEQSARNAPNSPRVWVNLGVAYQEQGLGREAVSAFTRALALDGSRADAYANRGALYSESASTAALAQEDFDRALQIQPDNIVALVGRGTLRKRLQQSELALADYQQAIASYRNRPQAIRNRDEFYVAVAYYQLGLAYKNAGLLEEAAAAYAGALRLRPGLSEAWFNLGVIQLERELHTQAIKSFSQALRHGGVDADAYYFRGLARWKSGDHDSAQRDLLRALNINPADSEFWWQMGLLRADRGDLDGARRDLSRACQMGQREACVGPPAEGQDTSVPPAGR